MAHFTFVSVHRKMSQLKINLLWLKLKCLTVRCRQHNVYFRTFNEITKPRQTIFESLQISKAIACNNIHLRGEFEGNFTFRMNHK